MSTPKRKPTPTPTQSYAVNLGAIVKIPELNANQLRFSTDDWVKYGDNNLFPDFLMKSVKKSPRHSRFINLRENMIKGGGMTYSDNLKPLLDNLDTEGQTIDDLMEDWSTDMSILESFSSFVRYGKGGKNIAALDYVDSSKVRPSKTLDENGKIQGYWVCADWSNTTLNPPKYYQKFNPNAKGRESTQLFFYHKRAGGQPFLPEISYASCLNWVEMEEELSVYGLNAVLNKFFGSAILQMKANMSDDDKLGFKRAVDESFTGSQNGEKLMVIISEEENTVKVTPVTTGDNTPFIAALSEMSEAAICTAHGGQPVLAGIQSKGSSLGSDGKLIKIAQELYHSNVILQLQKPILNFLKRVFKFNGIMDFELDIKTRNLVSEDVPEWFLMDYVKKEVLAARFGLDVDDLIEDVVAPTEVTPVAPPEPQPLKSPYPDGL